MTTATFRAELKDTWTALFPTITAPEDAQLAIWGLQHAPDTIQQGLLALAKKHIKYGAMDRDYMLRFASAVMNRVTAEFKAQALAVPTTLTTPWTTERKQ